MITQLGVIAGDILTFLEQTNKPLNINELESSIDYNSQLIQMSLGWLVREGYVHLNKKGDNFFVSLIKNDTLV